MSEYTQLCMCHKCVHGQRQIYGKVQNFKYIYHLNKDKATGFKFDFSRPKEIAIELFLCKSLT